MKFIAAILSIYILVLVAFPCADKSECNVMHKTELSQQATASTVPAMDECSPFCVCNCCVSIVLVQIFSVSFESLFYTHYRFPEFKPSFSFAGFSSIWQPPQLN